MRELIVVLALLARCWTVIEVLCKRSSPMPVDTIDEVHALRRELGKFFRDPLTSLGPMMGDALGIGAEDGQTGVSEVAGLVVVPSSNSTDGGSFDATPSPVGLDPGSTDPSGVGRVVCPQCLGKKDRPANNFIGDRSRVTCPQCNGVGSLSAPLPVPVAGAGDGSAGGGGGGVGSAVVAREWEPYRFTRTT